MHARAPSGPDRLCNHLNSNPTELHIWHRTSDIAFAWGVVCCFAAAGMRGLMYSTAKTNLGPFPCSLNKPEQGAGRRSANTLHSPSAKHQASTCVCGHRPCAPIAAVLPAWLARLTVPALHNCQTVSSLDRLEPCNNHSFSSPLYFCGCKLHC